jgi:hypothetical protein
VWRPLNGQTDPAWRRLNIRDRVMQPSRERIPNYGKLDASVANTRGVEG